MDQANASAAGSSSQFLRLCLQARWHPEALKSAQRIAEADAADWEALLPLARRGGLAPLLYHSVRTHELLPLGVEQALRLDYLRTAARNVRLFDQLERVLGQLTREGVPAMVLKGAALAPAIYGNLAVRPMGDIDLLVREGDVPGALLALRNLGYEIIPPTAYRCEVMVRKPKGPAAPIELHWHLFVPFYYQYRIAMDWFWNTSQRLDVGDASARMLGPEAQLLHLCGHLHLHHGGSGDPRLVWLYDVAAVVARNAERIDWEELIGRCEAYDLVLPVQRVLSRAAEEWRAPIPPSVLEDVMDLEASGRERRVARRLTRIEDSVGKGFWGDLADIPSRKSRLHFLLRNLFPPAGYVEQIYGVAHPFLVPVYYAYRWALGVRRAAR